MIGSQGHNISNAVFSEHLFVSIFLDKVLVQHHCTHTQAKATGVRMNEHASAGLLHKAGSFKNTETTQKGQTVPKDHSMYIVL